MKHMLYTVSLLLVLSFGFTVASGGNDSTQVIVPNPNDVEFLAAAGTYDLWCRAEILVIVAAHGIGIESLVVEDFAAPGDAQLRPTGASALQLSSEKFENRGAGIYGLWLEPSDGLWRVGQYQVALKLNAGPALKSVWVIVPISASEIPSCFIQWSLADGGNGHWYKVVHGPLSWNDANQQAQKLGGYLATITSAAELQFLQTHLPPYDYAAIGGLQDPAGLEPDGGWGWVTGEAWEHTAWLSGEPNNYGGNEDCLAMYSNYTWNDVYCYWVFSDYLLELESP